MDEAVAESHELANEVAKKCADARPGKEAPNQRVVEFVASLIRSPKSAKRGQLLTRLNWLPEAERTVLMECINGDGPYGQNHPDVRITLENKSDQPVGVTVDMKLVSTRRSDNGAVADTYNGKEVTKTLAPGEQIELRPHWADIALHRSSGQALKPWFWESASRKPDDLVEVGYRALNLIGPNGSPEEFDSRNWKPPKRRAKDDNSIPAAG
jgi:hypothetical protein